MDKNVMVAVDAIKSKIDTDADIAIILGSGLGNFADLIEDKTEIPYKEIKGFASSTVKGHEGKLIFGKILSKNIIAMKRRIHYYEGMGMDKVVFPTKVLKGLGIKNLIVTNASGGVNKSFKASDLMLINDHINFAGINPLVGPNDDNDGPRFPDMTYTYDKNLQEIAKNCANKLSIDLKSGVYMYFTGPTYETPAEVRMARVMGADAVGMSTVPEVIVARHLGLKVLGISCITNMASGILDRPLNHKEVMESAKKVEKNFQELVKNIINEIPNF